MKAHEATMQDIADLEGMKQDLANERVAHTSDTQQRILEMQERLLDHQEAFVSEIKTSYDKMRAAVRLIDKLDNPRWKQVLTCRYIAQMGWKKIAEEMNSTDDAVRVMCTRAIEHLEAIQ